MEKLPSIKKRVVNKGGLKNSKISSNNMHTTTFTTSSIFGRI